MDEPDLPARALRRMAADLEQIARQYRARAATLDGWDSSRRQAEAQVSTAYASHQVLRSYMAQGLPYEQALTAAVTATGMPAETIEHHWRRSNREGSQAEAEARAIEVMRLAGKGWDNHRIGQELGLHPGSVSRIVSKRLRQPD